MLAWQCTVLLFLLLYVLHRVWGKKQRKSNYNQSFSIDFHFHECEHSYIYIYIFGGSAAAVLCLFTVYTFVFVFSYFSLSFSSSTSVSFHYTFVCDAILNEVIVDMLWLVTCVIWSHFSFATQVHYTEQNVPKQEQWREEKNCIAFLCLCKTAREIDIYRQQNVLNVMNDCDTSGCNNLTTVHFIFFFFFEILHKYIYKCPNVQVKWFNILQFRIILLVNRKWSH